MGYSQGGQGPARTQATGAQESTYLGMSGDQLTQVLGRLAGAVAPNTAGGRVGTAMAELGATNEKARQRREELRGAEETRSKERRMDALLDFGKERRGYAQDLGKEQRGYAQDLGKEQRGYKFKQEQSISSAQASMAETKERNIGAMARQRLVGSQALQRAKLKGPGTGKSDVSQWKKVDTFEGSGYMNVLTGETRYPGKTESEKKKKKGPAWSAYDY